MPDETDEIPQEDLEAAADWFDENLINPRTLAESDGLRGLIHPEA